VQMWLKFHCSAQLLSANDLMPITKVLRRPLSLRHVHTSTVMYVVELLFCHCSSTTLHWPYNYFCLLQVVFGLPASAQHDWKDMQMVQFLLLGPVSFLGMRYSKFSQLNWLWWHHQVWTLIEPLEDYEDKVSGRNS
jgi:hypothetical protein